MRAFARRRQLAAFLALIQRTAQPLMTSEAFARFVAESDALAVKVFGLSLAALGRECSGPDGEWTAADDDAFARFYAEQRAAVESSLRTAYVQMRDALITVQLGHGLQSDAMTDAVTALNYVEWVAARLDVPLPVYPMMSEEETRESFARIGIVYVSPDEPVRGPIYDANGDRLSEDAARAVCAQQGVEYVSPDAGRESQRITS